MWPFAWDDDPWSISESQISKALDEIGDEEFVVNINSPGGSVYTGKAIYNLLAQRRPKVSTMIIGNGASAAAFVSQAGEKRIMAANTEMFLHEVQSLAWGSKRDIRKEADDSEKLENSIIKILAERAKITENQIRELFEEIVNLSAEECLEYGFIDEIWTPPTPEESEDAENLNNKLWAEHVKLNYRLMKEMKKSGGAAQEHLKEIEDHRRNAGLSFQITPDMVFNLMSPDELLEIYSKESLQKPEQSRKSEDRHEEQTKQHKINFSNHKKEEMTMANEPKDGNTTPAPSDSGAKNRTAEELLNEKVTNLEDKINSLKEDKKALHEDKKALHEQIKSLETENQKLMNKVETLETEKQNLTQQLEEANDKQIKTEVKSFLDKLNAEKKLSPHEVNGEDYQIKLSENSKPITLDDMTNLKKQEDSLKFQSGVSMFETIKQQLEGRQPLGGLNTTTPAKKEEKPKGNKSGELNWQQFKEAYLEDDGSSEVAGYIENYAKENNLTYSQADKELSRKIEEGA